MNFQIKEIIIWPLNSAMEPRRVQLRCGVVNVIVGDSRTGKSTVWAIIDYCLGSSSFGIPMGIAREKVAWFGIIVTKDGTDVLVARQNPRQSSSRAHLTIGTNLTPPHTIAANTTLDSLKKYFNRSVSQANCINEEDKDESKNKNGLGAPSYRDFLILNYLAQYILMNPTVIFLKQSNDISIQKLKRVLPRLLHPQGVDPNRIKKKRNQIQEITGKGLILREEANHLDKRLRDLHQQAIHAQIAKDYKLATVKLPPDLMVQELEMILRRFEPQVSAMQEKYLGKSREDSQIEPTVPSLPQPDSDSVAFLLGRISGVLEFAHLVEQLKSLRIEYRRLNHEIYTLNQAARRSVDNPTSEQIQRLARELNLPFQDASPELDLESFELCFYLDGGQKVPLEHLGGTQTYIGYHIATYLAVHEVLRMNPDSPICHFLFIDEPSQYFPRENEGYSRNQLETDDLLPQVFQVLNNYCCAGSADFQIIVMEKQWPAGLKELGKTHLVETWTTASNHALVPAIW